MTRPSRRSIPRTGSLLAVVPDQSAAEVRAAIARARTAFGSWSTLTFKERSRYLMTVRDRLLDRAEELVEIICAETGKQRAEAVTTELMAVCETMDWYAKNGERSLRPQQVAPGTMAHKTAWKRYEPMGVIGVISPWNYPFTLSMTPLVTALFAGNAAVLKPSEVTPTVGLAIGELFEDDDWGDLVQVVTGGGATGEAVVRGGVDKVVFTGSVRTGKRVMAAAADTLTPVLLELGGKDPMIVCDGRRPGPRRQRRGLGGHPELRPDVHVGRARVRGRAGLRRVRGPGLTEAAAIRQDDRRLRRHRLDDLRAAGRHRRAPHRRRPVDKGANGAGGRRSHGRPGLWFAPTVLVDVDHSMAVMTEETFGPVLPIMEVARRRGGAPPGQRLGLRPEQLGVDRGQGPGRLASPTGSRPATCASTTASSSYAVTGLPFGGVKESGIGRVHGTEGLREFCQVKSILGQKVRTPRELWWFPVPAGLDALGIRSLRLRFGSNLRTKLGRSRTR